MARERRIPGIKWLDVNHDELVIFLDRHDSLLAQNDVQLSDLQDYTWIRADIDGMRDYVDLQRQIISKLSCATIVVHSLSAVLKNLHHLKAFAIMPKTSFEKQDQVTALHLNENKTDTRFKIGLAYLGQEHSPTVARFVRLFKLV